VGAKALERRGSGPFIAAFAKNVFFADDLGIGTVRVDTVEPIKKRRGEDRSNLIFDRCVRAFDLCAEARADRGMKICWEFDAGIPDVDQGQDLGGLVRSGSRYPNSQRSSCPGRQRASRTGRRRARSGRRSSSDRSSPLSPS